MPDDTAVRRRYPLSSCCLPSDPGALRAFLEHPSRPAGTLIYHELQGFLFTVVSAPELIPPSDWLPMIFGDEEAGYADLAEANEVMGEIMALYNTINAAVLDPPTLLPGDCRLRDEVLANFADDAPITQWSRGFLRGHQWLEELWDVELPATFMALTFFASRQTAENFVAETEEHSLDTLAEAMVQVFPEAVASFARIGRSIHEILAEEYEEEASEPVRANKIGRNDPCPCGSGKKYKKCCGGTVH